MNNRDKPTPSPRRQQALSLRLPRRTLLVLCGVAGCGKSTFAADLVARYAHLGLRPTTIVSSDFCRALICDDENNQLVSRDSFDLFHFIIDKRMQQGVFTIADSTALKPLARIQLLDLARRHHYTTCLLAFDVPLKVCIDRDQRRARSVGAQVISYQDDLLSKALLAIPDEGWHYYYIVPFPPAVTLEILPDLYNNKESSNDSLLDK